MGGKRYTPLGAWHHANEKCLWKAGADCLRLEVKDFGIDVVIVEPGWNQNTVGKYYADNLKKNSRQRSVRQFCQQSNGEHH